jgi:hypothetical protein
MSVAAIALEAVMLSVLHLGDLPTLLACVLLAGMVYLGCLYLLDRTIVTEGRAVLSRGL